MKIFLKDIFSGAVLGSVVLSGAMGCVAQTHKVAKPENVVSLLSQPDVDGALVGGASLKADLFLAIIRAAC